MQTIGAGAAGTCQPGARGSRQSWCQGQVLMMLGHYGWILPIEDIDHPNSAQTDGKIYIHKRDIADGAQLAEGDIVGFYLYSDDQGLGAEEARCLEKATAKTFNASAPEYVSKLQGMNADANEFVPAPSPTISMDKSAVEFMPFGCNANLSNLTRLQSVFAINLSYLSDDSSDDEDSDFEERPRREVGKAAERCLSPGASTSAGLSSDDEDDDITVGARLESLPEACLAGQKFRPPPGLTLPSSPCPLAVGILTRAGMSVEPEQQQKLPPWRRDGKSSFADVVSNGSTPPWRRSGRPVACA